jgi:USP6 N-terminal-like protein
MAPSPAPNEDPDSYFVRATYAALDVSGVKGDGYEEGEELTRARLGSGRGNLPSPSPDTAKRLEIGPKELNEKEVELLGQVDRLVSSP